MLLARILLFLILIFLIIFGYLKLIPILFRDAKSASSWLIDKYAAHLEKQENKQAKISGGEYFDDDDTEQVELDEKMYQDVVDEYNPHEYDDYSN